MNKITLSFFGLGYVGLVYAAVFAHKNIPVIGFDIDTEKLNLLKSGKSPIFEPGLDELIKTDIEKGLLTVTDDPIKAVHNSNVTFITVGTPSNEDGSIDLKYVIEASKMIGEALKNKDEWHLVVMKSTVTPGTTNEIVKTTIEKTSNKKAYRDFGIAVNPEFLKEGNAIEDCMNPDRIIIGANDEKSAKILEEIYQDFKSPKIITSLENAELIKYANNTFLAMKVSFINMIANLCQKIPGTDVETVAKAIGLDKRIGPHFLKAGAGWGGSCWPKDLKALIKFGEKMNTKLPLVNATLEINNEQPYKIIELAEELIGELKNKKIAILGLSFKPNTDDIRDAVSIKIIKTLLNKGAHITAYDPAAMKNFKKLFNNITYANTPLDCIKDADCALIITEWDEFKKLKPEDFTKLMKNPAIVDGRRIYNPHEYTKHTKFKAIGLGPQQTTQ
jgi:UDPglucose 6-dehydrogenase